MNILGLTERERDVLSSLVAKALSECSTPNCNASTLYVDAKNVTRNCLLTLQRKCDGAWGNGALPSEECSDDALEVMNGKPEDEFDDLPF